MRAYVVSGISGGEAIASGKFQPLVIDCWYIEHNGKSFIKSKEDFRIAQFVGIQDVSALRLVPAGYLTDEAEHR